MLRGIRKASANWLGKAVMGIVVGFLIISFGIWGIGDIFRGFGQSTVAQIGSIEITLDQFRQTYNDRLQQIGRQIGKPMTSDQARALGLDRQIVGQLVADASLDNEARRLGLNLSNAEIARQITADQNFRGPTGQFDKPMFERVLRAMGYSEARYASEQRNVSLRRQIAMTVSGEPTPPKAAAQLLNRYENEQRAIEYVRLDRNQAGELPDPTPEVLAKYFEDRKVLFRAPEYRKIEILLLTPLDIARGIEVPEAEVRRSYEDHRNQYGTPERRQVQQIVFAKPEEAAEAADKLAKGMTFAQLAAERGLKDSDIDLGLVTKAGMLDPAIASAAFALPEGGVSAPVTGKFVTAIVTASKIEPEHIQPFEEVAAQIRQQIATERAKPELQNRHDKIEDERAGGAHLDEVGQKLKLNVRTIEAVDRSGRDPAGKPVPDLPPGVDVIGSAFGTEVGVEADPLQIPGGGLAWYEVMGVTPSRERKLDEVKDQVEARWRDDQVAERVAAKATEMADKLKAGTPFAELAAGIGAKVETTFGLKRAAQVDPLPAKALELVFRTPKGGSASAEGKSAAERIVFTVTDVTEPAFDAASPEAQRFVESLRRSLSQELYAQYIQRLETDIGTRINEDAMRRAIGASSDSQF